ncbi:MAG: DUF2959 family protein [Planctomycetota bacterium]
MVRSLSLYVLVPVLLFSTLLSGCRSAYYSAMESLGYEKRDILIDRVEEGRELQSEASEQVQSTYDALVALTGFDGGDLEQVYRGLERDYERSEARAEDLRASVRAIEEVARAMFTEWRAEIDQISNPELQRSSSELLDDTRDRYNELVTVMQSSVTAMDPVLQAFKDQVLTLKHRLNAQAIEGLSGEVVRLEADVAELIEQMQASIAEADEFISSMRSPAVPEA